MSILIVRKDLFGKQLGTCPDMLCYERTLTANSVINTPYTLVPLLILKQLQLALSQGYDLKKIRD
jgi:phosphoserine aminotransferase